MLLQSPGSRGRHSLGTAPSGDRGQSHMAAPEGQTSPAGCFFSSHHLRMISWLSRALKGRLVMAQTADPGLGWQWVLPSIHSLLMFNNVSICHFT